MTAIEYDSAARPPRAIEELRELANNLALVRALVERNLKVRYRRSALGFLWTMISPTVMLVALSAVFTRAFAAYAPTYPAYVFPGLLLWNFFAQTTTLAGEDIASGGELWRRVRFPKTALAMAHLRGVLCLAVAKAGLPLLPLTATTVKQRLTGNGHASKEQVQRMVFGLCDVSGVRVPSDLSDAIGLAIAGLHQARVAMFAGGSRR